MDEFGLSPGAVQSIIDSRSAIERYQHRLDYCYAYLSENHFTEGHFKKAIEPELIRILEKNGKTKKDVKDEIRDSIRRWALLSQTKSHFLIRLHQILPEELDNARRMNTYYHDIPSGCVTKNAIIREMKKNKELTQNFEKTMEVIKRWHDGNLLTYHKNSSFINFVGVLLSEQFFVVETLCRMILIGSCLEFSLKSIDEKTAVQHKEIYQTLKRMGDENNEKILCKMCSFKNRCKKCEDFLILSQVYEFFYHLRVLKDYKKEFWDMNLFFQLFNEKNLAHMFSIVIKVQQIEHRIHRGYWSSPFNLYRDTERINTLLRDRSLLKK